MYPLLEPLPHAAAMQQDFMSRMEKDPPPWLIHVRVPTSWLAYPDSHHDLLKWMPSFIEKHYQSIRVVQAKTGSGVQREIIVYSRK